MACADTIAAHGVERQLSDLVFREFGDEVGIVAVVGEADGHVGLTSAGDHTEVITLYESVVALWRQAQHELAQCYYFCHILIYV